MLVRKNYDFDRKHRKQVPLLHNTVLFLCDEGAGLVAVFKAIRENKILAKISGFLVDLCGSA